MNGWTWPSGGMHCSIRALAAWTIWTAAACAQPEPGWGYAWERAGDRGIEAEGLSFGPDGTLWAIRGDSLRWLDPTTGPGVWTAVSGDGGGFVVLPLQGDTLLVLNGNAIRSIDRGGSFETTALFGRTTLTEVMAGHSAAGRLLMGTLTNATGAAYSNDRGASWTQAVFTTGRSDNRIYHLAAAPPAVATGRILAAGVGGLYLSDDSGATFRAGPVHNYGGMNGRFVAALARPDAGWRSVLLVNAGQPHVGTYTSEDGGDTWSPGPALVEPEGTGLGWPAVRALMNLGGGGALGVLGRGRIHRTDDAGLTWQEVAQAPRDNEFVLISGAALGPDGRLYVSSIDISAERGWVYRTQDVVVSQGPPAPAGPAARLIVLPNPTAGAQALVRLTLAAPADVELALHDTLGRRVAQLHAGTLAAGPHEFGVPARLPAGVYVARADGAGVAARVRLVVAR
jgi:hypothetical protein